MRSRRLCGTGPEQLGSRCSTFGRDGQRGFTLIELMVTVLILSLLASIALPSLGAFQRNNRLESAAQNLNSNIRLARSEAISKNSFVRVQLSSDQTLTLCRRQDSASGCPGANDLDTFRTLEISYEQIDIESADADLGDGFVFNSQGRLVGGGSLDIGICDERGAESGKVIRVNPVGRSRLSEIAETAGASCS